MGGLNDAASDLWKPRLYGIRLLQYQSELHAPTTKDSPGFELSCVSNIFYNTGCFHDY